MFKKYVSNTSLALGTSYLIESTNGIKGYRIYVKPTVYGKFKWRFFFINSVNSTYGLGEVAHANVSGGSWKIHKATIGISASLDKDDEIKNVTKVTYNGSESKCVSPDEHFWSDEIDFEINDGYIVWEWDLEGENIPSMPEDIYTAYSVQDGKWAHEWNRPAPCLFGVERPYKKRIAFLGDSITAGCGTKKDGYEMWVARIADELKDEYAVWNLGLGFGRGSDCATDGSWLYKAKQYDIAVITYGVNDIKSGEYGKGKPSSAGEIVSWAEAMATSLQNAGVEVIISTIPPFSYNERERWEWRCANLGLKLLAKRLGARVYDIASSLESEPYKGDYPYGDHPNGEGCRIAFEKFKQTFIIDGKWTL